jgi:hypothetical protein
VTAETEGDTPKGKDRPLAARRNLVKKAQTEVKEVSDAIAVDSKDSDINEAESNESPASAAATTTAAAVAAPIKITSNRTREIEKEIAMHNATFDKAAAVAPKKAAANKVVIKKQVHTATQRNVHSGCDAACRVCQPTTRPEIMKSEYRHDPYSAVFIVETASLF